MALHKNAIFNIHLNLQKTSDVLEIKLERVYGSELFSFGGFLATLEKIILAEHKPVFLRMVSLMPITNGQLATSSHIPGKHNR